MVNHFTVTLGGSAQRLSDGLSGFGSTDKLKFLSIQANGANANLAYVGGSQRTLTSSDYGYRIEVPVATIPYAPTVIELPGGSVTLGEIYVLGTATQKLHVLAIF